MADCCVHQMHVHAHMHIRKPAHVMTWLGSLALLSKLGIAQAGQIIVGLSLLTLEDQRVHKPGQL